MPQTTTVKKYGFSSFRKVDLLFDPARLPPLAVNSTIYLDNGSTGTTKNSNPQWKDLIAKGKDVSSYYKVSGFKDIVPCHVKANCGFSLESIPAARAWCETMDLKPIGVMSDWYHPQRQDTLDTATARFRRNFAAQSGSYQAITPAAELKDFYATVRGVNKFLTVNLQKLLALRRIHSGKEFRRILGDAWLTINFGLNPLIGDVKATALAIAEFMARNGKDARVSGSASDSWTSSLSATEAPNSVTELRQTASFRHEIGYRYTSGVDFSVLGSNDYSAIDHFQLGWPALIPTAWELLAYSWVVDYFVTIGPYLEDTFSTLPGRSKYINLSRRYRVHARIDQVPRFSPGSGYTGAKIRPIDLSWAPGSFEFFEFERVPQSNLPTRTLRIKSLDEVGKFGLSKLLNLASLL